MKKSAIAFTLLAATLLALAACGEGSSDDSINARDTTGASPYKAGIHSSPRPGSESPARVTEHVTGLEILTAKHGNLFALSAEEAAWLDRHGYPTKQELDALQTYDAHDLESAMRNRGDPKSAALLGHKRMIEGDWSGALAAFSRGAHLGSMYSQQQLAIASAQRATGLAADELADADQGNIGVLVAQLEVARLLGDHRAQSLIDRYTANFHWDQYGKHVLTQTAIFMDQYGEYARSRGERLGGPDPRPNAEAWARLHEDPDAVVTVYTRGRPNP